MERLTVSLQEPTHREAREATTRLLIVSFSPIASDARVLKQVAEFVPRFEVTTVGYGEAPSGVAQHIRIPDDARVDDLNGRLITFKLYRRAYESLSAVRWARSALRLVQADVVLANDVEAVPIALGMRPTHGVHADLHEYSPRLHEDLPAWDRRIRPYYEWLCRRFVAKARSWSTVSDGLAREYGRQFGFNPVVVTNAAPYVDAEPTPVGAPIRLVHSGACLRNRNLMTLIEAVVQANGAATLDLYLTANDPAHLDELRERASRTSCVEVRDAVPYTELPTTLNGYDVGVHVLPPLNFNNEWALPNKLFDYVQARLGVIVGPSAEMARYVREFGLGAVTDDFTSESLARQLRRLNRELVLEWKRAADAAAHSLSSQDQVAVWSRCIRALLKGERVVPSAMGPERDR
jgi:hypothetical protein